MSEEVTVLFRKYKSDGEVIALFPERAARANNPKFCESYGRQGWSPASIPLVMLHTRAASPDEAAGLKAQIESMEGFENLVVVTRTTPTMNKTRRQL